MVRRADGRARLLDSGVGGRRTYFRLRPLNELCLSNPSEVMSRYSTSAKNVGSTHVAFGFLIGVVSLDFGLTTVSSWFLIWLETVRDQPVPTLPIKTRSLPSRFPRYSAATTVESLTKPMT